MAAGPEGRLEFVEKVLTTNLTSTDATERNAGMLRVPLVDSLVILGYWLELLGALVVVAKITEREPRLALAA